MFILKKFLKYLNYKRLYPGANIAFGAYIAKDSNLLDNDIEIGQNSYVIASSLGNNIKIKENCRVANSTLGSKVNIEKSSCIEDSNLGDNVRIQQDSLIINSQLSSNTNIINNCQLYQTKLDKNTLIHQECFLHEVNVSSFSYIAMRGMLLKTKIGKYCSIGPNLICGSGEHPTNLVSTSPAFYLSSKHLEFSLSDKDYFENDKVTYIGNDVWVGAGVFIKNGIKIGNGAVIAAGAVVVKDIPDYAIVGGVPAKIIRFRFPDEVINELLKIQWWDWNEDKLRQAQTFFVKEDILPFIEWVNKQEYY